MNKVLTNKVPHGGAGGAKGSNDKKWRSVPDLTATQSAAAGSSGLERLHTRAKAQRKERFTNLFHHLTPRLLAEAYKSISRKETRGLDGESWSDFGNNLRERILDLHTRLHRQCYRPQAVCRIWLPKADGSQRPIGITAVEDKVVQQALVWVLEAIYEADFLGFSYGFRPGRDQHRALDAIAVAIEQKPVSWILDADISQFFDTIDHGWLRRFLAHRIADRRLLHLIERIVKAGVVDDGRFTKTRIGTPQGAVISPMLANIYLHYVLDLWAHQWRQQSARGACYIVRYADDSVMGFQYCSDAEHFQVALTQRLAKFGLQLNADKTRLLEFGRFAMSNAKRRGGRKPESFTFLGFTHRCGKRVSDGRFALWRTTSRKRLNARLKAIRQKLFKMRHKDVYKQGQWLQRVMQGHYNYFAVPRNHQALNLFRREICRAWLQALRRRGQKKPIIWARLQRLLKRFIPSVRVLHPYPNQRLCV
ncbi:group II intron reverse transcriptase/maturase [Microbulbifer sp. VVAC002]|uniref:group II intron reverse transcriptase/maturase n=1 Tax=Microbulbifer sp. VVAC002 TaxID=3243387 RepID=UPI00403A2484